MALIFFYSKRRKSLNQKVEAFKKDIKLLEDNNHIKKEPTLDIDIDTETTNRILADLVAFENSTVFLKNDFNLNLLAKLLNTNTSYLSRIINDHKKRTFKQYLIELRINTLIHNMHKNPILRKYSIEVLAESIGYNNASSFTRIFKSHIGESPSSFLNKKYPERKK